MPALPNARHERFAQEVVSGKSVSEAYEAAGFKRNDGNARRLRTNEAVSNRIEALLSEREAVDFQATQIAIEKLAITKERVLGELAKIGFADIRKAVRWSSAHVEETDNPDGGDVLVIKQTVSNLVEIIGSSEVDDDTAAAIAEISQNEKGGVKIKMHDKKGALVDLGRHLGLFRDKVEHSGPNGGPIPTVTASIDTDDPVEAAKVYQRIMNGGN